MAFRTSWKGYLKLSLVSVPVKSYSAVSPQEGEIHFHQLHDKCHSRIKYTKTCPLHGVVPPQEIVSGYEYAKGQYVVLEPKELDALKGEKDKSVNVEVIVPINAIDSLYVTEHSSYLLPDGRVGEKPYAVIEQCLTEQESIAIGRLVLNGKDEVVMIRPLEGLLVMTVLSSAAQVKEPRVFAAEKPNVSVSPAELKLTKTLFDAFYQETIDLALYKDQYTERVADLINAKIGGQEVVTPTTREQPDVINLMDALKRSLAQSKPGSGKKTAVVAERTPVKSRSLKSTARPKPVAKQKSKTA